MTTCYYAFEIPDPARPIAEADRGLVGPSGHLMPFVPQPLQPADVIGLTVTGVSMIAGTYGMGGPGFFALELAHRDWLVVAVWGAGSWITCRGRLLEDMFNTGSGRPRPWSDPDTGECDLLALLDGEQIVSVDLTPLSLHIALTGGNDITINPDPTSRPVFAGNKMPRAFKSDDDLRRAVFLSSTLELWV